MDDGRGKMMRYSDLLSAQKAKEQNPLAGGIFHKGQVVEFNGSRFKITQVLQNGLKLKLLPKE